MRINEYGVINPKIDDEASVKSDIETTTETLNKEQTAHKNGSNLFNRIKAIFKHSEAPKAENQEQNNQVSNPPTTIDTPITEQKETSNHDITSLSLEELHKHAEAEKEKAKELAVRQKASIEQLEQNEKIVKNHTEFFAKNESFTKIFNEIINGKEDSQIKEDNPGFSEHVDFVKKFMTNEPFWNRAKEGAKENGIPEEIIIKGDYKPIEQSTVEDISEVDRKIIENIFEALDKKSVIRQRQGEINKAISNLSLSTGEKASITDKKLLEMRPDLEDTIKSRDEFRDKFSTLIADIENIGKEDEFYTREEIGCASDNKKVFLKSIVDALID